MPGAAGSTGTKVFCRNLPAECDLSEMFCKFGKIVSTQRRRTRGYGFVVFDRPESAAKAVVAMDGSPLPAGHKHLHCSFVLGSPGGMHGRGSPAKGRRGARATAEAAGSGEKAARSNGGGGKRQSGRGKRAGGGRPGRASRNARRRYNAAMRKAAAACKAAGGTPEQCALAAEKAAAMSWVGATGLSPAKAAQASPLTRKPAGGSPEFCARAAAKAVATGSDEKAATSKRVASLTARKKRSARRSQAAGRACVEAEAAAAAGSGEKAAKSNGDSATAGRGGAALGSMREATGGVRSPGTGPRSGGNNSFSGTPSPLYKSGGKYRNARRHIHKGMRRRAEAKHTEDMVMSTVTAVLF